ncbi:MAG: hypothetical protein GC155_01490 [Alphaproteobacteria bacterium]|nr:hypothetical protein [Alphaproteobacteria bacterium]
MSYRTLNADQIETTLVSLQARIEERFPERGISRLCAELVTLSQQERRRCNQTRRPNFLLRAAVGAVVGAGVAGIAWLIFRIATMNLAGDAFSALQGLDSLVNLFVLAGAAVWFLLNLESRMRREAVLRDLHELRSIAHVVDMHQISKDPPALEEGYLARGEAPGEVMSDAHLLRYLDYCSDMLALTGKLAALYMQDVQDPVIIQTVNEIENLTGNLSRKIWQKVMVLRAGPITQS